MGGGGVPGSVSPGGYKARPPGRYATLGQGGQNPHPMSPLLRPALLLAALLAFAASLPAQERKAKQAPRALSTDMKPWKGDFEGMVERRMIRVLVPYSRTLYYNDKGRERGLTAELVRDFEQYVNKK